MELGWSKLTLVAMLSFGLGAWLLFWLGQHALRSVSRRDVIPVRGTRLLLAGVTVLLLFAVGTTAFVLRLALNTYTRLTSARPVAEIQCIELAPQKLRLFFVV